jgi:hypothetical protein
MNPVHADGINWMEVGQRLTLQPTEGNVPADFLHGAAGFDSSRDIPSRQMLVLEAYGRLSKDSYLVQTAQHPPSERDPSMRQEVLRVLHSDTLSR